MTVDEVIKRLEYLKSKHGNKEVRFWDLYSMSYMDINYINYQEDKFMIA